MAEQQEERRKGDSRLTTIAFAICLQAAGSVWWAATITSDLRSNTKAVEAMQVAQYTKSEARSDFRNVELQVVEVARRVNNLEERKASR